MGRARLLLVVAGVIAVTVLISCGAETPIQPTDYSTLTVDSVAYYCAAWHPAPPSQARGLFDVLFFGHTGGPPTEEDRARIRVAGGEIVYEFHEPIIRAVLDATAIPGFRSNAWGVTDPDVHLLTYNVIFFGEVTEEDREYVSALGGTILREGKTIYWFYMKLMLPDASVPDLYTWDRLSDVDLSYIASCPAKPGSPWRLPASGRRIVR